MKAKSRAPEIKGFHAHVYYDPATKETAARVRQDGTFHRVPRQRVGSTAAFYSLLDPILGTYHEVSCPVGEYFIRMCCYGHWILAKNAAKDWLDGYHCVD